MRESGCPVAYSRARDEFWTLIDCHGRILAECSKPIKLHIVVCVAYRLNSWHPPKR
jgi:hypothetical protein